MTFENHTENECDKCGKKVGKKNLIKVPFIYLDKNDKSHKDVSEQYGYPKGRCYRQYYVCKECDTKGV